MSYLRRKKKRTMTKEGAQQHASTLDRPAGVARPVEQALQVQRGPIRQRMAFEIPPEAFDGIQFWRVGWEEDRMDLGGDPTGGPRAPGVGGAIGEGSPSPPQP